MPRWLRGKESTCWHWRHGFDSWVRKIPCRMKWNPLQYSCLENPMVKGGWQATVCGIMYSNSCPLSRWCHPAISSSVVRSPRATHPSQHQGLFQSVNSSHEVAKVLEFQLQHQSFQCTPRTDLLQNGLIGYLCSLRDSQESSPTPQFKSINS